MYAGLMALELLGIPSRWLATRPASPEQLRRRPDLHRRPDRDTGRLLRALASGHVCLAVDGAANPAAPRASFAGQEVTYSGFAAHLAHRQGVPSVFYAPRWETAGGLHAGDAAATPGEDADAYALRWRQAYFEHLRAHVAGPPENLRLSGGIWRHVQATDRSAPP